MSTRSILAFTSDNKTFSGVYCHSDGYPTGMVPELAEVVARGGADAVQVLTGHARPVKGGVIRAWMSINAAILDPADVVLEYDTYEAYMDAVDFADRDLGLHPLYIARYFEPDIWRENVVPGIGRANRQHENATSDGGFSGTLGTDTWDWECCEWQYVFTSDLDLIVYALKDRPLERARFTHADLLALAAGDESVNLRVQQAECGENFEWCGHYVMAHFPDVPEESQRLGVAQWLGTAPMEPQDAVAARVNGRVVKFGRSFSIRWGRLYKSLANGKADRFVAEHTDDGWAVDPALDLIFPPTAATLPA